MAKVHQSFKKINCARLTPIFIWVALVCLLQFYHVSGTESLPNDLTTTRVMLETDREQWPFLAALYHTKESKYFCGGTLISKRHILTAAHCIQGKGSDQKLTYSYIEVHLGEYNLTVKNDENVVLRNVSEIFVHLDWNVYNEDYDADIAILVLNDSITFTKYIQAIRLPAVGVVVDGSNININGTIVGWVFRANNTHEEIPRQADMSTIKDGHCYRTYKAEGILALSSDRTFCAGSAPNLGDYGGGFFVNTNGVWRQYGIISSIRSSVTIYTNVHLFQSWIKDTTMDMRTINLECAYHHYLYADAYQCTLQDLILQSEDIYVGSVTGSHETEKTEQDVNAIYFVNGTMLSIPNGLGEIFKNVKILQFTRCLNTKLITRTNLQNLEKMEVLLFVHNKIEELQFDSLWDMPVLEAFHFLHNELKVLDERTFEKNIKLKRVYLQKNRLEFLPQNLFQNNFLLEDVRLSENSLKKIEIDFTAFSNFNVIDLNANDCIDANYAQGMNGDLLKRFTNLSEFQRHIRLACSSTE